MGAREMNHEDTVPSRMTLCTKLARGKHKAGAFLLAIDQHMPLAKAQLPGVEGVWIARDRTWWEREACLTPTQYDGAIKELAEWGLIEKCQGGPKKILHVRTTALVTDYLAAATTWDLADAFLETPKSGAQPPVITTITTNGKPGDSAISLPENEKLATSPKSPQKIPHNGEPDKNTLPETEKPDLPPSTDELPTSGNPKPSSKRTIPKNGKPITPPKATCEIPKTGNPQLSSTETLPENGKPASPPQSALSLLKNQKPVHLGTVNATIPESGKPASPP